MSKLAAPRERRLDAGLALALFAGVVLYQSTLPHELGVADEAYLFYHGLRVFQGQVPYRDFTDLVTPLTFYVLAGVFWLLGPTMQAARLMTAAVDGGTAVLLFAACRALGAGRMLAIAASVAQVVLFQPAWPFASPHWFATLLTMALLVGLLRPFARETAPSPWLLGVLSGILVLVAQQRATIVAVGVPGLVLLDHLVTRALGGVPVVRERLGWFLRYVAAGALVVVPGLGLVVAAAGFRPVWEALVMYPLRNYAPTIRAESWGSVYLLTTLFARETFPAVLRWLPLALAIDVGRLVPAVRHRDLASARRLILLLGFSALAVASIWYFHDFIHIAFIAPMLLVPVVELIDASVRRLPSPGLARGAAGAVAIAVLMIAVVHAVHIREARARAYPVTHQTAFGEVVLPNVGYVHLIDRVRSLAASAGTHELYSYPSSAGFYLLTGLDNPTRFSWLFFGYSQPEAFDEVIRDLEKHQTLLILLAEAFVQPNDPFLAWLNQHYTRLKDPETEKATGTVLFMRKAPRFEAATR